MILRIKILPRFIILHQPTTHSFSKYFQSQYMNTEQTNQQSGPVYQAHIDTVRQMVRTHSLVEEGSAQEAVVNEIVSNLAKINADPVGKNANREASQAYQRTIQDTLLKTLRDDYRPLDGFTQITKSVSIEEFEYWTRIGGKWEKKKNHR